MTTPNHQKYHARVFRNLGATHTSEWNGCANNNSTHTPPATASPSAYQTPQYDSSSSASLDVFRTFETAPRRNNSNKAKTPALPLEPIKVVTDNDRSSELAPPSPASCPSTPENANGVWVWPSRDVPSKTAGGGNGCNNDGKGGSGATAAAVVARTDKGEGLEENYVSKKPSITVDTSFASTCRCGLWFGVMIWV